MDQYLNTGLANCVKVNFQNYEHIACIIFLLLQGRLLWKSNKTKHIQTLLSLVAISSANKWLHCMKWSQQDWRRNWLVCTLGNWFVSVFVFHICICFVFPIILVFVFHIPYLYLILYFIFHICIFFCTLYYHTSYLSFFLHIHNFWLKTA